MVHFYWTYKTDKYELPRNYILNNTIVGTVWIKFYVQILITISYELQGTCTISLTPAKQEYCFQSQVCRGTRNPITRIREHFLIFSHLHKISRGDTGERISIKLSCLWQKRSRAHVLDTGILKLNLSSYNRLKNLSYKYSTQ